MTLDGEDQTLQLNQGNDDDHIELSDVSSIACERRCS
jgi:hypothetical protein